MTAGQNGWKASAWCGDVNEGKSGNGSRAQNNSSLFHAGNKEPKNAIRKLHQQFARAIELCLQNLANKQAGILHFGYGQRIIQLLAIAAASDDSGGP